MKEYDLNNNPDNQEPGNDNKEKTNIISLEDMKEILKETDEWARRRIRAVYWKQWKKIKTKYRMLKAIGLEHWKAKELAYWNTEL